MGIDTQYSGSHTDEWGTPDDLWGKLNEQYHFTVDLAASRGNQKCSLFFSKENSFLDAVNMGLKFRPTDVAWCNPPFSIAGKFYAGIAQLEIPVVSIYKANNLETKHWRPIWETANWILVLPGRTQYITGGKEPGGCPFGSALLGWRCASPEGIQGVLLRNWAMIRQ
jgi:hypothetical protein